MTPIAVRVREASERAAEAITARQVLIDTLPSVRRESPSVSAPSFVAAVYEPLATSGTVVPSGSQVSVQSVLAVVGAALFAIAAIVFTFLNPDLTNFGTRTAIVGSVTLLFLAGAWFLARAKLQFSAEAIGALGTVFLVLDVWALSTLAGPGISGWVIGGTATLVASILMVVLASRARIRTWLWIGLVGIAVTPAFFGYAAGGLWAATLGHVGVVVVALGVHEMIRRLRTRFAAPLAVDRLTATLIQIGFATITLVQLFASPGVVQSAAVIGVLAVVAALNTRNQFAVFGSLVAGALFVTAISILPLALDAVDLRWQIALFPLAGAVGVAALAGFALADATRARTTIRRPALLLGGWFVALLCAAPAAVFAAAQVFSALDPLGDATDGGSAILGVAAASAGSLALSLIQPRLAVDYSTPFDAALARRSLAVALWAALLSILATSAWTGLPDVGRVIVALGIALTLSVLVTRVHRIRSSPLVLRTPIVVGAHLSLVLAGAVAWSSNPFSIVGDACAVLLVLAVARTVPSRFRWMHSATGFAFALVVVAHALALASLDTIPVLCLTTSVASLFALAVTLVRRLGAAFWLSILAVTAVPFLIGIASVLFVRSGWTALSTGVTFALALTLVVTRRPGVSRMLRAFAAALLVPTLAVVVVCLGAQLIVVSASPITLPVIALIVACVLPSSGAIGSSLLRRGLPEVDVLAVTRWIEVSALVTGALAVVVALVRAAAGLGTSLLVLLIIGLGAAVTAVTTGRRYGWAVAGASWTGALWCFWALVGVAVPEPYILPPALAAVVLGAISVGRKLPGSRLYSIGLAFSVVPSLFLLAGSGPGLSWRVVGLLSGSAVLVLAGGTLSRRSDRPMMQRLGTLRTPTLLFGMVAASAGAVEAIRLGWSMDPIPIRPVMFAALAFSAASAALAGIAGALVLRATGSDQTALSGRLRASRWVYAPAFVYLVIGPISAVRDDWFSIWTLWVMAAGLLAVMVATTVRAQSRPVSLPPVWFLFVLAWCAAVAGWSERQLRVEAFSLVLGIALLIVGVLAMRGETRAARKGLNSWPVGYTGSWRLLAPGIIVTILPSAVATGTDPQTLRAILVIALALAAILIGSLRKLGAPFILGIIVLPLENITVFAVQVGHSISAAPWWITLATAGAVLLVVSVTYERRDAGSRGVAARLRDLR
jgi:hypothetical protein